MTAERSIPGSVFGARRWWSGLVQLFSRAPKHPFDRAHRVDTDGLIYADPAATGHASGRHNAGYYATAPSLFRGAVELWRAALPTGRRLQDYSLIDIGCGKGRVLMLAAEYDFREIIGVELDPELARIARKNLRKWRPRSPILRFGPVASRVRVVEADALDVDLPDTPVVLFYFNSFEREMMEKWIARLKAQVRTRAAPVDLIYVHPEHDALIEQRFGIEPLAHAEIKFSPEDAIADVFNVADDRCSIYRIA